MEEVPGGVELSSLTVVLFHSKLGWRIGSYDEEKKETDYCCTQALISEGICSLPNVAIINQTNSADQAIHVISFPFQGDSKAIRNVHIITFAHRCCYICF